MTVLSRQGSGFFVISGWPVEVAEDQFLGYSSRVPFAQHQTREAMRDAADPDKRDDSEER